MTNRLCRLLYDPKADREVIEIVDEEKVKEKVEEYLRSL